MMQSLERMICNVYILTLEAKIRTKWDFKCTIDVMKLGRADPYIGLNRYQVPSEKPGARFT